MIHSQHKKVYFRNNKGEGGKQRFFFQLLNNLQTLPVYSLRGGGGLLSNGEGEKKKDRLFGETAVRRGEGESKGDVKYMRRKGRRTENTGMSREIEGKKNSFCQCHD